MLLLENIFLRLCEFVSELTELFGNFLLRLLHVVMEKQGSTCAIQFCGDAVMSYSELLKLG